MAKKDICHAAIKKTEIFAESQYHGRKFSTDRRSCTDKWLCGTQGATPVNMGIPDLASAMTGGAKYNGKTGPRHVRFSGQFYV